jgi:hypothetical protein
MKLSRLQRLRRAQIDRQRCHGATEKSDELAPPCMSRKRRALARLRLDPNPTPMHLNDALGYSESQAGAALLLGYGIVGLLKLLKQPGPF